MARPKKGTGIGATTHLGLRIPPALRTALDQLAERHGRPLAEEVRDALESHVARKLNAPARSR